MNILYLDLETTGLDTGKDRIVELAFILENEQGERENWETLINPGRPIPKETSAIHGIFDKDVAESPRLDSQKEKIAEYVQKCDILAGYNVIFDLKVLMAEAIRIGITLPLHEKKVWDMQKIFFHHEPRNLSAAYKYYCGKTHEGAHRAMSDVEVTIDIFKAQQEKYQLDMNDQKVLSYTTVNLPLDSNGAFVFNKKQEVELAFGKHRGKKADLNNQEVKNYLSWMIGAKFPDDTKAVAKAILKGRVINKENLSELIQNATQ
ncbi:MAG: 3'-5' exonuclease [Planctomycetes bacterium]|nr:3'-5' exonuclease [Planctomycetota bacterium]